MFINTLVKDCSEKDLPFKVNELKPRTYYVAEVKLNKNNPIHKVIMATGFPLKKGDEYPYDVELFSTGYENILRRPIENIYWFNIICEIPEMKYKSDFR